MAVVRSPLIGVMLRAAERASVLLRRDFGELEKLQSSRKGLGDFVSSAGLRCEGSLVRELFRARPHYSVFSEESGERSAKGEDRGDLRGDFRGESKGEGSRRFVIDPLDGTLNFMHGIGHVSLSIAVEDEAAGIVAGVVYDPLRFEGFWAERGVGSFLHADGKDTRLRTSSRNSLGDSLYATALSFDKGVGASSARDRFLSSFRLAVEGCCGVRLGGCAALDLAYVAAGRLEGFWGEGLRLWDCAAGLLLVELAGGGIGLLSEKGRHVGRSVWQRCGEGILAVANEPQAASFREKVWRL